MWLAKGLSVPEALRISSTKTAIAIRTSKPTRSSLKPIFLVDFGMTLKDEGRRMKDEPEDAHRSLFILYPSSFILSLVSAQKFIYVGIVSIAERFIRAAENNLSVAYHQDFTINQAKLLALFLENYFAGVVYHRVFRG